MISPFGTKVVGFKVTIGGVTDPAHIERTYADIDRIVKSDPGKYTVHEERTPEGTFKSLTITT